jgi:acyl-CoA hydrolase
MPPKSERADHRELGVHTEVLSDGIMELIEQGSDRRSRTRQHRNKHLTTFCVGTRRLFDFLDHNGSMALLPVDEVNHPMVVAREPNFVSINVPLADARTPGPRLFRPAGRRTAGCPAMLGI